MFKYKCVYLHQVWHLLERWTFADQCTKSQSITPRRCHVVHSHVLVTFNHSTAPQLQSFCSTSFTHLQMKWRRKLVLRWFHEKYVKRKIFVSVLHKINLIIQKRSTNSVKVRHPFECKYELFMRVFSFPPNNVRPTNVYEVEQEAKSGK